MTPANTGIWTRYPSAPRSATSAASIRRYMGDRRSPSPLGHITQCHLAYLSIKPLTCTFMPDGRLGLAYRPERICAGQNDTEGLASFMINLS
jgi:hypothetical protein